MMVFVLAVFALFIAVLVGLIMVAVFSRAPREPGGASTRWMEIWPVLFLIFLAIWAGGLWITPAGPTVWGVAWVPLLFIGLIFALFWAAIATSASNTWRPGPPSRTGNPSSTQSEADEAAHETARALSIFFCVLLVILAVAILARAF